MDSCRAAERALVSALVLGEVKPSELAGAVRPADFTDPAARTCFTALTDPRRGSGRGAALPSLLREHGQLRSDGYPVSHLLEWLPSVPVPAHPQAWGTLVVAHSLSRVVQAAGTRLEQAAEHPEPVAGRVLTVAAVQRATVHAALSRWEALPEDWRATLPPAGPVAAAPAVRAAQGPRDPADIAPLTGGSAPAVVQHGRAGAGEPALEREVVAGFLESATVREQVRWLAAEDLTDPAARTVLETIRTLHAYDRPVDAVTVASHVRSTGGTLGGQAAELAAQLGGSRTFTAATPFLARRVLELSAVRQAGQAGRDITALAGQPEARGGLGRPQLQTALHRLDGLRAVTERLDLAHRPPSEGSARGAGRQVDPRRTGRLEPAPVREVRDVRDVRGVASLFDRHAG